MKENKRIIAPAKIEWKLNYKPIKITIPKISPPKLDVPKNFFKKK